MAQQQVEDATTLAEAHVEIQKPSGLFNLHDAVMFSQKVLGFILLIAIACSILLLLAIYMPKKQSDNYKNSVKIEDQEKAQPTSSKVWWSRNILKP